jgi:threonine aldolase
MTNLRIDLYSDTVTKPSAGMRKAIAEAEVGNEQAKEDPTTNKLQDMTAELFGKEAAVFVPSGTMCNAIAYRVHCEPGDEVMCDRTCHTIHYEVGGPAALAGVMMRPLDGARGIFTAEQVEAAFRRPRHHHPRSRLVSLENTSMGGGGTIWPVETMAAINKVAKSKNMIVHMDGARFMNAVVGSGIAAKTFASHVDTLWLDLTKGLGCPVGAVLAGPADFIERAWRFKHQFGGAMRQSGIIAAAGVYALQNNVQRLAEDHANAKAMVQALGNIPGVKVDPTQVQTNIVFFDISATGWDAFDLNARLLRDGIRIGAFNATTMRALTHLDVTRDQVMEAVRAVEIAVKEKRRAA